MRKVLSQLALAVVGLVGAVSTAHAGYSILTFRWGPTAAETLSCDSSAMGLCAAGFTLVTGAPSPNGPVEKLSFEGYLADGGNNRFYVDARVQTNSPGTALIGEALASTLSVSRAAGGGLSTLSVDFISYGYTNPDAVEKTLVGGATTTATSASNISAGDYVKSNFTVDANALTTFGLGSDLTTSACDITDLNALGNLTQACTAPTKIWTDLVPSYSLRAQQELKLATEDSIWGSSASISIKRVPEPMTTALVGLGLVGAAFATRRRKAAKTS